MALAAFLSSFVRLIKLIEYYSLYIFGILLHLYYLSTGITLYLSLYNCVPNLPERCNGVDLMFMQMIALCHSRGCIVVFNHVSMVLRLSSIIIWAYMLQDSSLDRLS